MHSICSRLRPEPLLSRQLSKSFRKFASDRPRLAIADHAYVIEVGRIVLEGKAAVLAKDERVQKAYLGGFEAVAEA